MTRHTAACLFGLILCTTNFGCLSRAIREGAGVVTGAAGKVVPLRQPADLSSYRGLTVAAIKVQPGLRAPGEMPSLIRRAYAEAGEQMRLSSDGSPALMITGEIIHYEAGGVVDTAIGPLQEVIVRTQVRDAYSQEILGEANLIGRSKATTSGGARNLSEGTGKALKKWLKRARTGSP